MNNTEKVYIGYCKLPIYKGILAISKRKEVLLTYLEEHRQLDSDEYSVEREEITDLDLLTKYSEYIISEYEGYYIPEIDQDIIDLQRDNTEASLKYLIDELKRFAVVSNEVSKIPKKDISNMVNCIRSLDKISKTPKYINKINRRGVLLQPILFCEIEEYLKEVRCHRDMKELNTRYNYLLDNEKY